MPCAGVTIIVCSMRVPGDVGTVWADVGAVMVGVVMCITPHPAPT